MYRVFEQCTIEQQTEDKVYFFLANIRYTLGGKRITLMEHWHERASKRKKDKTGHWKRHATEQHCKNSSILLLDSTLEHLQIWQIQKTTHCLVFVFAVAVVQAKTFPERSARIGKCSVLISVDLPSRQSNCVLSGAILMLNRLSRLSFLTVLSEILWNMTTKRVHFILYT